jgi:hypothetical protein
MSSGLITFDQYHRRLWASWSSQRINPETVADVTFSSPSRANHHHQFITSRRQGLGSGTPGLQLDPTTILHQGNVSSHLAAENFRTPSPYTDSPPKPPNPPSIDQRTAQMTPSTVPSPHAGALTWNAVLPPRPLPPSRPFRRQRLTSWWFGCIALHPPRARGHHHAASTAATTTTRLPCEREREPAISYWHPLSLPASLPMVRRGRGGR